MVDLHNSETGSVTKKKENASTTSVPASLRAERSNNTITIMLSCRGSYRLNGTLLRNYPATESRENEGSCHIQPSRPS